MTFSEPMDTASAEAAFSLSDGASNVAGTFSWSGDTMSFDPGSCLAHGTTYQVKVTTSSQDAAGNHLEREFITHFSTLAADPAAPSVAAVNPVDLTVDVPVVTSDRYCFLRMHGPGFGARRFLAERRGCARRRELQLVGRHDELSANG